MQKLLWSVVVLLAVVLVASHAQSTARPESQVGRFQIIISPKDGMVLRLDTATGKTLVKSLTDDNAIVWSGVMPEQAGVAREAK